MEQIFNSDKINKLQTLIMSKIDTIIDALEIKLIRTNKMYVGSCPIHGGDNNGALNLYHNNEIGIWRCNTRRCETIFIKTILGFIRGVLSHQKYRWNKKGDKIISFNETISWICKKLGIKLNEIENIEINDAFAYNLSSLIKKPKITQNLISREMVRRWLIRPAKFFIDRGYSSEILDKFDVGLYPQKNKRLSNRIIFPVYEDSGKYAVGFTGRIIYPKCKTCERYHIENRCGESLQIPKWQNSEKFFCGSHLYNYWNAAKFIKESCSVVLVEGPPDVLRLEEAGIQNAVSLFGCDISDEQHIILERSGAMNVVLLLDNDEVGMAAKKRLAKRLERSYNIVEISYKGKDVGELSNESVKKEILPFVRTA